MVAKTFADILEEATERARLMDAPLEARLKAVADEVDRLSPEFSAVVARMVARLKASDAGQSAPQIGDPMPDFLLPDETGQLVSLGQLIKNGPLVISFNRGHWCPYCRLNVDGLARIAPEVSRLGGQIVTISPESRRYGAQLKSYARAPFAVLADSYNGYALELNLMFWVGDEKRAAMQAGGFDITPYQNNDTWMLPIPATFIVGRDGTVKARYVGPDYRRRMDPGAILTTLAKLGADDSVPPAHHHGDSRAASWPAIQPVTKHSARLPPDR
jgi:peroxiredoxin